MNFAQKIFFRATNFSCEKCSEIFPEIFEPLFCGSEQIPGKFPPNFPLNFPNFPAKNQKKIHRRASAGAQGERRRALKKRGRVLKKRGRILKERGFSKGNGRWAASSEGGGGVAS